MNHKYFRHPEGLILKVLLKRLQVVLEFNFADASRKWLIPLEDTDTENDNAGERLPSPVPVPKVCKSHINLI